MSYNTLWTVPDSLWLLIVRLVPAEKLPGTPGRPALPHRQVVDGIPYVLQTGCQWKSLRTEWFGASSSIHDRHQTWCEAGIWKKVFHLLLRFFDKLKGIRWRWQTIDSKSVAAPKGAAKTGKKPTDWGKLGCKRHLLVDAR